MKLVAAIIKPVKLDEVREALGGAVDFTNCGMKFTRKNVIFNALTTC